MGHIVYGSSRTTIEIDDRELLHLQHVVITKLRRRESFTLTRDTDPSDGYHRSTVWIHPELDLEFRYTDDVEIAFDRDRLEELMRQASHASGIQLARTKPPAR